MSEGHSPPDYDAWMANSLKEAHADHQIVFMARFQLLTHSLRGSKLFLFHYLSNDSLNGSPDGDSGLGHEGFVGHQGGEFDGRKGDVETRVTVRTKGRVARLPGV